MSFWADETAVQQTGDGAFSGFIHGAWNIGDNPNGGYMVSMVLRAVAAAVDHPHPVSVTTHFLRPGIAGSGCDIYVDVVRTGRTLSTVRARLEQEGQVRLEVLTAFGDLTQASGVDHSWQFPPPPMLPPESCVQRSAEAQGVALPLLDRLDTRLDRESGGDDAAISGWIRLLDGTAPGPLSLPIFADAFPPSPFSRLGPIGWVPTLELTVHVRRLPVDGWIQGHLHTEDLENGRMVESGALWDEAGNLVVQCRQLGLVMQRN